MYAGSNALVVTNGGLCAFPPGLPGWTRGFLVSPARDIDVIARGLAREGGGSQVIAAAAAQAAAIAAAASAAGSLHDGFIGQIARIPCSASIT